MNKISISNDTRTSCEKAFPGHSTKILTELQAGLNAGELGMVLVKRLYNAVKDQPNAPSEVEILTWWGEIQLPTVGFGLKL